MTGIVNSMGGRSGIVGTTVGTPSSDVVKLYSVTPGTVASVSINGYFDDTIYGYYKLMMLGIQGVSNGTPRLNVMTSNSVNTTSNYWSTATGSYSDNGGANAETKANDDGTTSGRINTAWNYPDDSTDATFDGEIVFSHPQAARWTNFLWAFGQGSSDSETRYFMQGQGYIIFKATTALTGIHFTNPAGNSVTTGTYILYGYKK
tara:strand:+ start:456 stop:1067 length:612 start_codon:yes stop_codon:yes gene_type:complete